MSIRIRQKREVDCMDKRLEAERLFFVCKKSIKEVAIELGISTKTATKYLKANSNYQKEKSERKQLNNSKRREHKKKWDRKNRATSISDYEKAVLKNQHIRDVGVLTYEKF